MSDVTLADDTLSELRQTGMLAALFRNHGDRPLAVRTANALSRRFGDMRLADVVALPDEDLLRTDTFGLAALDLFRRACPPWSADPEPSSALGRAVQALEEAASAIEALPFAVSGHARMAVELRHAARRLRSNYSQWMEAGQR